MSSRSQFRSIDGCCICGTKSSSSRFSNSSRFSQYFSKCFGPKGEGRHGDICNACVLYVKRWCKASDQSTGKYEKVLDKKKGPGLKHITQIVKMQQRRQARLKAFGGQPTASHGMETRSKIQKSENSSSNDEYDKGYYEESSCHQYVGTNVNCKNDDATSSGVKSGGSSFSTKSFVSSSSIGSSSSSGISISMNSSNDSVCSSDIVNGAMRPILSNSRDHLDALSQDSLETDVFRVPEPCRNKNYKKRVHLPPVKLPNADEVDHLLREIMARNSEVVNFEIPLAMQNHLRLRSRTIMQPSSGINKVNNNQATNNDQASVSSDSFGSSVGNVDLLRN